MHYQLSPDMQGKSHAITTSSMPPDPFGKVPQLYMNYVIIIANIINYLAIRTCTGIPHRAALKSWTHCLHGFSVG